MARILQSIIIGVLLTAVQALHARADGALEDAQLNAAVAVEDDQGDFRLLERLVLRTTHGRAFREDGRLTLFFEDGHRTTLQDKDCLLGHADCVSYYLLADLPGRHAFVVRAAYPSGHDIRLIDDRTGRQTLLPAPPQFGPDSGEFITFENGGAAGEPGITIWQWRDGVGQVVWRHRNALDPIHHATTLVRWAEPDAIHLDFWCYSGPHWPATATRRSEGWRLESKWPRLTGHACSQLKGN
jgi:hypothetical protein